MGSVGATCETCTNTLRNASKEPTISSNVEDRSISSRSARFSFCIRSSVRLRILTDRADFIPRYFHVEWPDRAIYHTTINTAIGDDPVIHMILDFMMFGDKFPD